MPQAKTVAAGNVHPKDHLKEILRPYYLKWFYFKLSQKHCPPEFKRWLEYPSAPLESAATLIPAQKERLADAIFLPMTDWHGIRQRSQQLARALSTLGHRCFYLNPHLGREFPQVYAKQDQARLSFLEPRIAELHVHLRREPVFHHRRLKPDEIQSIGEKLLTLLDAADSKKQMSIVGLPVWTEVALKLRRELSAPIIYDCHDLLEGFEGIGAGLIDQERELLETADLVVFSADWLANEHLSRLSSLATKSVVIRNGAESHHFEDVARSQGGEVTIGYTGALNSWFDVEAVRFAAAAHPEWRFLLVGPSGFSFSRDAFSGLRNIQLTGEVPYQELPKWMAKFDVATIPFLIQPLTMATNPVKLYEYFACGLPVVSSPLAEVMRYSDLVYVAKTPAEFARQLELALAERYDDPKRIARRQVAQQESWINRSETLIAALSKVLEGH